MMKLRHASRPVNENLPLSWLTSAANPLIPLLALVSFDTHFFAPWRYCREDDAMTYTYSRDAFQRDAWFDSARPQSRRDRIARIDALATLLDTAFILPGTNVRFGLDALIGLVPGIGDAITPAMSLYIVHEARQLGAPRHLLFRMLANVALDGIVGAVPVAGDAFDVMWRANRRNMRLLHEWLERVEDRQILNLRATRTGSESHGVQRAGTHL
jgi:hypothetical protein